LAAKASEYGVNSTSEGADISVRVFIRSG